MNSRDEWISALLDAWQLALKECEILNLSMLLRDIVSYGRANNIIDEDFALDVQAKITQLEALRPEMSPGEVSKSLRAVLYARKHIRESTNVYGAGFQSTAAQDFGPTPGGETVVNRFPAAFNAIDVDADVDPSDPDDDL